MPNVSADDYEDDDEEEEGSAATGAKQPLSSAKDTVSKLAEKACSVAGVGAVWSIHVVCYCVCYASLELHR